jgi:polyisoprenoid-binding protein YceI
VRPRGPGLLALLAAGASIPLGAPGRALAAETWRVEGGDVQVVCPLTVGGTFEARTSSLSGTLTLSSAHPPALSGEVRVDLASLDTGIELRNQHMRNEYLEIGRGDGFASASLGGIRLGDVDAATFQGKTTFSGTFAVHGTARLLSGQAEIRREGGRVTVVARFPVSLDAFGIPKPRYLGVGVKDQVDVKVVLEAVPADDRVGSAR